MASGSARTPGLISRVLNAVGNKVGATDSGTGPADRIARLGLSERAQLLNRKWAWYRTQQYDARKIDWSGRTVMDEMEVEAISSRGFIPPGFVDAGQQSAPLRFRKPSTPYGLAKVVVDRFTGLLFSEGQHPLIQVNGDPVTEDFIRTVADVARLWQQMILARTYGGAMGSVAVGFQFVDGKPVIEVHDPRWCEPEFVERSNLVVKSIEKRYQYPKEERDPESGRWETVWYWYRRIIDDQTDTVFQPVPVGNGKEPEWQVLEAHPHGLGFCPVIWVQNLPVQDETDGDPDCHGAYDMLESIDALLSQAQRGIISNCDPTLVITSKSDMGPSMQKGSGNAFQVPDGDAKYLEMTGGGSKAALDMVQELRAYVLEVVQCVLEAGPIQHNRTATEVNTNTAPMLAKADVMREQYGERCVKPLLEMMYKAAQRLNTPKPVPVGAPEMAPEAAQLPTDLTNDGNLSPAAPVPASPAQPAQQLERYELNLPPKYVPDPGGAGGQVAQKREIGLGGVIELKWPDYFRPTLADIVQATTAAAAAKTAGLLDSATLGKFIARFFDVEDPAAMVAKANDEFKQAQDQLMAGSLASPAAADPSGGAGHPFGKPPFGG